MKKFYKKIIYIFNPDQKAIDDAKLRKIFELEVEKAAKKAFTDYKETFQILSDSDKGL